jgi:flagellar motor switch protein FliN
MENKVFDDPLNVIDDVIEDAFRKDELKDVTKSAKQAPSKTVKKKKIVKKTAVKKEVAKSKQAVKPDSLAVPEIAKKQDKKPFFSEVNENLDADISEVEFPVLAEKPKAVQFEDNIFNNIPVKVTVELGKAQMALKDIYDLGEGSIIELNRLVGEPLALVVNGQTIAHGEVVAIDNYFGLRLTKIEPRLNK